MSNQIKKKWTYYNPVECSFGQNFFDVIASYKYLKNVLLVTTQGFTKRGVISNLLQFIHANNVIVYDKVSPNPAIGDIDHAKNTFGPDKYSDIIAVGGGSVIDTAKVLSVILHLDVENPLEKIFRQNKQIDISKSINVIAVPTTSGTGAECTPFSTIWDPINGMKYSLNNNFIYPKKAILDPQLTLSLPLDETLYTGLDTISHAMESLWNINMNHISRAYSLEALWLINNSFEHLLDDLTNITYRSMMMQASFLSGMAISQTKTAIAHSISYPLTYTFGIPHGLACGFTLPAIADFLKNKETPDPDLLPILIRTTRMLRKMPIQNHLEKFVKKKDILRLINEMYNPSRMDNFILKIDRNDIITILTEATE